MVGTSNLGSWNGRWTVQTSGVVSNFHENGIVYPTTIQPRQLKKSISENWNVSCFTRLTRNGDLWLFITATKVLIYIYYILYHNIYIIIYIHITIGLLGSIILSGSHFMFGARWYYLNGGVQWVPKTSNMVFIGFPIKALLRMTRLDELGW